MGARRKWQAVQQVPAVRTAFFTFGLLMMMSAPAVGLLPGPGGVLVFGGGLALSLKYSEWAKRHYVRFKRKHPRKGAWTDWGMRRASAKRREHRRKHEKIASSRAGDD